MAMVDFSAIQSPGDKRLIEPGNYIGLLETVRQGKAASGTTVFEPCFQVLDEGEFQGERVYDKLVMTPNSLWKLKIFLRAMGEDASGEVEVNLDLFKSFIGKKTRLTVSTKSILRKNELKTIAEITRMEPFE